MIPIEQPLNQHLTKRLKNFFYGHPLSPSYFLSLHLPEANTIFDGRLCYMAYRMAAQLWNILPHSKTSIVWQPFILIKTSSFQH
jgi:hypothetical protein